MNAKQETAIKYLHHFAIEFGPRGTSNDPVVATFEVNETDWGGVFVIVTYDIPTLPENNFLRVLTGFDHYHFSIGPRGAIKAIGVPKSMEQFQGKRVARVLVKVLGLHR